MRITKPLTDTDCRALKPDPTGAKRPRIYDGGGLFPEALPNGRKLPRLKYVAAGRETKATFGDYPVVTLKKARDKRGEARGVLADGLDVNESAVTCSTLKLAFAHEGDAATLRDGKLSG
ncbi:MAG: Arm DNA-binding domain-containing protein [Panacagrimonas sp.]